MRNTRRTVLSVFSFCFAIGLASCLYAQKQVVQSVNVHKSQPHALVIKFAANVDPTQPSPRLASALRSLSTASPQQFRHLFPNNTQLGLDRIVLIPVREGLEPEQAAQQLKGLVEIEYAEPNYIYHIDGTPTKPNDSLYDAQWHLRNIHAPEAWQISEGDTSIRIGFVDTGVDWLHPDLIHQFAINSAEDINHNGFFDAWPSTEKRMDPLGNMVFGDLDGIDQDGNGFADDVIGYDFVDQSTVNYGDWSGRDAIPQDENGHGTAVAGVLAAEKNNKIGIAGVAPKCRLVAIRAFDFSGNAEDDDVAAGIVYAADNKVNILNLSFGDAVPSLLQRDAIRYANAKGVLVFASSGNAGGDARHYPSDFDETVSVGATTNFPSEDLIWPLTQFSEGMDLVAPGDNIETLQPKNGYASLQGTSLSSPIAAAVAALLWSARPTLTNVQVRSILLSSTHDVSYPGYDHLAANGRVDALAALTYQSSALIKMTSPHTDDGFHVGDTIAINGSAISSLFQNYSLSYASGINPDHTFNADHSTKSLNDQTVWLPIVSSNNQVNFDTLGRWDTHGLKAGAYTLRLAVQSTDQRTTEERIAITLTSTSPTITLFAVDTIYLNEKRALQVRLSTDQESYFTLYYRPVGDGKWSSLTDDRFLHQHSLLLTTSEVTAGVPVSLMCVPKNLAGDSTAISRDAMILQDAISERGFTPKSYTLPSGFVLDSVLSFAQGDQVVMSVYPIGESAGNLEMFEFDGVKGKFVVVDSTQNPGVPRAIGNLKGSGKPDLLVQYGSTATVYEQNASHSLLGDVIFASDPFGNFYSTGLADVDGDGKAAIIGVDTNQILEAIKWNGSVYQKIGSMQDTSPPAKGYAKSQYLTTQQIAVADFLNTGKQDVAIVDGAANLEVYARDQSLPAGFRQIFADDNQALEQKPTVSSGDFNGDGKPDIAFVYHRDSHYGGTFNEYDPNYWTLKVFLNQGGGKFALNTVEHFLPIRDPNSAIYPGSMRAIPSVTGRRNSMLAISIFPNFYLFEYDSVARKMKGVWHYPLSITEFGAIAHDFDRNGKTEFGFFAGDSIHFFERDDDYTDRTATPGGLDVRPRAVNLVELSWGVVSGATSYNVLRADSGSNSFNLLATVQKALYTDNSVTDGQTYFYSVTALDSSKKIIESLPAFTVRAYVHRTPQIDSIEPHFTELLLHANEPVSQSIVSGGAIVIDDSITCSSIVPRPDSTLRITSSMTLAPGTHQLRVTSFELRDLFNSPFDQSVHTFRVNQVVTFNRFYILRWNFASDARIHVTFNHVPADDGLDVIHYTITPYGRILRIEKDPSDTLSLYVDLDPMQSIVPLGKPFVLCVTGIHDRGGDVLDPTGNCVGETLTASDLQHVFVYPNPASISGGMLTFAGLTATAEITIYSQDMHMLRRIETAEKKGGVQWDMTDEIGKPLPSGIYLYVVTGKNDEGAEVSSKAAKFVIVADQER